MAADDGDNKFAWEMYVSLRSLENALISRVVNFFNFGECALTSLDEISQGREERLHQDKLFETARKKRVLPSSEGKSRLVCLTSHPFFLCSHKQAPKWQAISRGWGQVKVC